MQARIPQRIALGIVSAVFVWYVCVQAALAQAPAQSPPVGFEELARSATTAREAGKAEEAIRDYQRALELHPEWTEGWWYLGSLEYDADRYAAAVPAFQKLVELAPAAGVGWDFLGLCEFETKDYGNSLEHLKKAQSLGDADDPEISRVSRYHQALLLIRTGDFEQATSVLAATFGQGAISTQVQVALGLATLHVPLLPEEIDPSRDAMIQESGQIAASTVKGEASKALEAFRLLLGQYPDIPYLRYAYGRTLAAAGRVEEALQQQQKEMRVSPGSALPRIEISQLQLRLKHPQESLVAAMEAVRSAPDSPATHRALGQALEAAGQEEKARREFEAAQKMPPEKCVPEEKIARLYALRRDSGTGKSAQTVTTAAADASGNFDELSREATESQKAGNTELAIQTYLTALQLRPDWDDGQWNLAMLLYSERRYPDAIAELKSFVTRNPNFGTAWAVMGLSEFETRDYRSALIHLERGEELGFGGASESVRSARYHLAMLLNQDGQFEQATQVLAPETGSSAPSKEIQYVLGMALLRIPLLAVQVAPAKNPLVQTAGEISALLRRSKYDLAFPKFEGLLKEYPATPFLHYAYGTALEALSSYEEAEKQLREEMKISSSSELPYLRLASMALKRRQPTEALPLAQQAVQLSAGSAEGHYLLGRASLELGQEEAAIRELETASRIAPGSPEVHFNLAKAYARAQLSEKAEQERAIFARLNALAEERRSRSGNQAYGAHNAADAVPARKESENPAGPQRP